MTELPNLIDSAKEDLSDIQFRRLVHYRCSKYPEQIVATPEEEKMDGKLEAYIGKNDLLPAAFLSEGVKKAQSVGKITVRFSDHYEIGTGFLIGPNYIMTNNHVLKDADSAKRAFIEMNYEIGVDGLPLTSQSFALAPDLLFITNPQLDFTIVATAGTPGEKYGWIPLLRNPYTITRYERVYIIQHPEGFRKQIGIHDNQVARVMQHKLRYTTDTESGSSGSPCFNKDWELVGLHHSKGSWDEEEKKWLDNEAIKISSVLNYLSDQDDLESDSSAHEVLSFTEGEDPYEGFFGKWGVKLPKESRWEKVVTDYRGNSDYLDVGFWNIKDLYGNVPEHRKLRIADVFSRLNLDVMGLVEVSEEPIKDIIKKLKTIDKTFKYSFKDVRGGRDLAVIYNDETVEVTEEDWDDKAKESFDSEVMGKKIFYRHPMKVRVKSKVGTTEPKFDFKLVVLHAKATTYYDRDNPEIPVTIREASAKALANAIEREIQDSENRGVPELDYVIGGDFNARMQEGSFDVLSNQLDMMALTEEDANSENPDAYTYLMRGKNSLIDHIYISKSTGLHYDAGSISITRIDKEMPKFAKNISDHSPIAMRLTWTEDRSQIEPNRPKKEFEVPVPGDVDTIRINLQK